MKPAQSLLTLLLTLAAALPSASAGDRRYSYLYETSTMPKGDVEFEHWFTWSGYDSKDRFDFRHEIEFGVTDHLQLGLYLANWRYERMNGRGETAFKTSALEAIYNLADPHNAPIGAAIYGEVSLGDKELGIETKLLLEKNFGPVNLTYNFKLEAEWEGSQLSDLDEDLGEFGNYLGASYQFSPSLTAGVELVHEWESEHWQFRSEDELFLGPNLCWRKGDFSLVATALWRVLDVEDAPEHQIRVLAGFDF